MTLDFEAIAARYADWETAQDECYGLPDSAATRVAVERAMDCGLDVPALLGEAKRADRYRLAWTSARQRAQNHLLALVDSGDERDELRAALREEQGAHTMTFSSFEIFVESAQETARKLRTQLEQTQDEALAHAARHAAIFDAHLRQVADLTDERDEARAEVHAAGEEIRRLKEALDVVTASLGRAFERANEAARLSAQARDDADALNKVIADLQEHIAIVEGDRTDTDVWALNVIAEHGIEHEPGDLLAAIATYIRECKDAIATYRHVADKSIEAREQYAQEAERLGAQAQHLVNRANEFRAARDHLLKAGRDWLDAGYPTVGEPATAGDAMAAAIEDVIANVPEGQSMWAMTDYQADALRALLGLVHYDELAQSWLATLPAEIHPQRS